MQDIADRVGLSKMSVSLALRRSSKLSPATVERVREVAREMGYVPDPLLRALNVHKNQLRPNHRGEVIAVVDNWLGHACQPCAGWLDAFWPELKQAATAIGYSPQRFSLTAQTAEQLQRILRARGITSLILLPDGPRPQPALATQLNLGDFAVVQLGRGSGHEPLPTVTHDHFGAMLSVVEACVSRGYSRPAFLQLARHDDACQSRYACAFRAAVERQPACVALPVATFGAPNFPPLEVDGYMRHHRPDVVIGTDAQLSKLVAAMGYNIPGRIGFACLESPTPAAALTGMHLNAPGLAAAAVDLIEKLLHGNVRGCLAHSQTMEIGGLMLEGRTLSAKVRPEVDNLRASAYTRPSQAGRLHGVEASRR